MHHLMCHWILWCLASHPSICNLNAQPLWLPVNSGVAQWHILLSTADHAWL